IAHAEHVTLVDGLSLHALSVELHAVGGAQIDHEIVATKEFHHRMLSRHVWIFDCEIGGLFSAPDDELVFGHGEALSVVIRVDSAARRGHRTGWWRSTLVNGWRGCGATSRRRRRPRGRRGATSYWRGQRRRANSWRPGALTRHGRRCAH